MKEADLMRQIQIAASDRGWRLWRNNIGFCQHCKIRFGLCEGSSDLIGLKPSGQFLAIEVKTARGITSKTQAHFLTQVIKMRGDGRIVRSVEEL